MEAVDLQVSHFTNTFLLIVIKLKASINMFTFCMITSSQAS